MSKIDLLDNTWTDLVFDGKNKAYGAYDIRRTTGSRNLKAIIITLLIIVGIIAIVFVKGAIENAMNKNVGIETDVELSKLAQKKEAKVDRKTPPKMQEEQKVVEKVKSSVKFTAPEIKKDEDVKPEDELKSQEDLAKTNTAIGSFDVKGNDDANGQVMMAKEAIAAPEPPKHEEENKVFEAVEQMPSFPGGQSALMRYLSDNVRYPVVAQENGVQGRVVISFIVERDGSITDVRVVRSVDPSLDKEAQRVVRSMPNWIPGKQNGSAVRVKYNVPVSFRLQ